MKIWGPVRAVGATVARAEAQGRSRGGYKAEAYLAETVGTYLLVFIGPGSLVLASSVPWLSATDALILVALVFGCTVSSMILLLGKRSGAHINPAITLAHAVAGLSEGKQVLPYVSFQLLGGLLAGLSLSLVFAHSDASASLGATKLAPNVSLPEGFLLESVGTFVLASAALTATSALSSPLKQAALVGGTLIALILLIGPLTGASFNPARSLGPSIFAGYFGAQEIYWLAPMVGGGSAGYLFGVLKGRQASV